MVVRNKKRGSRDLVMYIKFVGFIAPGPTWQRRPQHELKEAGQPSVMPPSSLWQLPKGWILYITSQGWKKRGYWTPDPEAAAPTSHPTDLRLEHSGARKFWCGERSYLSPIHVHVPFLKRGLASPRFTEIHILNGWGLIEVVNSIGILGALRIPSLSRKLRVHWVLAVWFRICNVPTCMDSKCSRVPENNVGDRSRSHSEAWVTCREDMSV